MIVRDQHDFARVANAFDDLAEAHDRMRWDPAPGTFDASVDRHLASIANGAPGRVVALGGGSGAELRPFVAGGWACTLVDGSRTMLDLARLRYPTGVCIEYGDAITYLARVGDGSFEVVLAVGELIGYVRNPSALLTATARVLTPNGLLVQTFADATRLRPRLDSASILGEDDLGFTFWERRSPPLAMTAFHFRAVLALQWRSGLSPVATLDGPGPRTCVTATRVRSAEGEP